MAGAKDSLVVMEILVVAAATLVVHTLAATTYHVGDTFGWQVPSGGYNYSNWATQHTFVAGDSLVFDFTTGAHTAAQVVQNAYDNCNTANPISNQVNGPATFTLAAGTSYYVCTIHCSQGQKLAVSVASSAGSPFGSPPPPSPPGSGTFSPPPPRSSATPTRAVAAASLIFLSVFAAFFC
ncbi:unnamed protein product [Coffea canephora]|uniref:Phytocyanin domain-containing protein n=2 Tax=Coffea TaxID=13442 RepID=A0A068UPG1_COFCA|nr:umecyanin-like [Coffea arabica]CDP10430.1 unnamed protein product [Coffea canephora]